MGIFMHAFPVTTGRRALLEADTGFLMSGINIAFVIFPVMYVREGQFRA